MSRKIEFEPGDVIKPVYSPENELIALDLTDDGFESLRDAVCEEQPSGSSGEKPAPQGDSELDAADERLNELASHITTLDRRVTAIEELLFARGDEDGDGGEANAE